MDSHYPPVPLQITVCMGSSCFSRGNNHNLEVIQNFLAERRVAATVEISGHLCQGQCKAGPNITINGRTYPESDPISVLGLLNRYLSEGGPWTT
jgi:NADH:ubiquinone oxidoreductase subunit E